LIGSHISIVVDCGKGPSVYEGFPSTSFFVPSFCKKKLKDCGSGQLLVKQHPISERSLKNRNCISILVTQFCGVIQQCLKEQVTKINKCCIPYHAQLKSGGYNSNSAAFWMVARCIPIPEGRRAEFEKKIGALCGRHLTTGWPPAKNQRDWFPDCLKEPTDPKK
jgi:hypothetical protein